MERKNLRKLKMKIVDFINFSNTKSVSQKNNWDDVRDKMNKQDQMMNELHDMAIENDTILGRIIKFQAADSYAIYIITKINKVSVEITWIDYCDGWIDDRIGKLGLLGIDYAKEHIRKIDALNKLFSGTQFSERKVKL